MPNEILRKYGHKIELVAYTDKIFTFRYKGEVHHLPNEMIEELTKMLDFMFRKGFRPISCSTFSGKLIIFTERWAKPKKQK